MRAHSIAEVQALIDHFGIAADEIIFTAKLTLPPRFRHPETGDTWHGYGHRPDWINDDNIDEYRIKPLKNGKKTGKKSSTKTGKQAEADQHEANDAEAEAVAVDGVTTESEVAAVAANVAPEATDIAVSEIAQQPVSVQGQQPAVNYGSSLMASGVQSYVNAVRAI
uniref:Uncharacterized protein n=1 Tax=Ralstonia syzygii R24 TaxID=907261 RepID=G3A632_9RALS|nr:hypothetical protein RALSY_40107 [Ralstonia syzygii R24]